MAGFLVGFSLKKKHIQSQFPIIIQYRFSTSEVYIALSHKVEASTIYFLPKVAIRAPESFVNVNTYLKHIYLTIA